VYGSLGHYRKKTVHLKMNRLNKFYAIFSPLTEYETGKEYVYKYESQVLTGLPTYSKQYTGLKVVSKVLIHFTGENNAILKVCIKDLLY